MFAGCAQCENQAPHSTHIIIYNTDTVVMFDDNNRPIQSPSTDGRICPLCGRQVSFIDPEFNNAYRLPCSSMGEVGNTP